MADNFAAIWSECPFKGGYDCSIGTSEHGTNDIADGKFALQNIAHLLVVFGGVEGLEQVVSGEEVREPIARAMRTLRWYQLSPF